MTICEVEWPGGKKVAVMISAVVELWSDGRWPVYAPMAMSWPLPGVHDTHSVSWAEYGPTTGVHRILDSLASRYIPATFGVSGLVGDRFPDAVRAIRDGGHEVAAHSWTQDVIPANLDLAAERDNIARCTETLGSLTGTSPTGWMSPRATGTARTPDLLSEAGYSWSGDYNDRELPYVRETANGPLVCIMHSEFTDVRGAMAGPRAYRDVHQDVLDYLVAAPGPGILNLTIHAHVGGRPTLANMFDQVLDHVQLAEDDVWVATHQEIAEHLLLVPSTPDRMVSAR